MNPARIAELLQPFLSPNPCHSEQGQRPSEEPAFPSPNPIPCHSEQGQRPSEEPAFLTPAQIQSISTYIDILRRWNARINLTAVRTEEEIVTRHFGESLFAAHHLFPRTPSVSSSVPPASSVVKDFDVPNDQRPTTNKRLTVADIGSGAGFPGIPIKLWAPEITLTLIESNHKKATFLREVIRALTLTDINVFSGRAEQLAATTPAAFDLVILRAVERFANIIPVAATLVAPGGRLALLIGSSQQHQAQSILTGMEWQSPLPIPGSVSSLMLVGLRTLRNKNQES